MYCTTGFRAPFRPLSAPKTSLGPQDNPRQERIIGDRQDQRSVRAPGRGVPRCGFVQAQLRGDRRSEGEKAGMAKDGSPGGSRRHELDWIRILVTLNLVPFHAAWLITGVEGFSRVERETPGWIALEVFVGFTSPLHMVLLFLVAGVGACHSLRRRSPGEFLHERVRRLLVPLITFMLFLFPLLGWYWPAAGELEGVAFFTEFWPWCLATTLCSPVTHGPNWAHMWFVGYLFLYSLLLLPLRPRQGGAAAGRVTEFLARRPGAVFLPALPFALAFALLAPCFHFYQNNLYTDWGYFAYNLTAFLMGFLIARDRPFLDACNRHFGAALLLGLFLSTGKLALQAWFPAWSEPAFNGCYQLYALGAGLNTWAWVMVALVLARRLLSFSNRFLEHFNRISYPYYILHLVVLVVAGHHLTRLGLGVGAEFLLLCLVTWPVTWLLAVLAGGTAATRFLFGIKGP